MFVEHERGYIVPDRAAVQDLQPDAPYDLIVQGYLAMNEGAARRLRRRSSFAGERGPHL